MKFNLTCSKLKIRNVLKHFNITFCFCKGLFVKIIYNQVCKQGLQYNSPVNLLKSFRLKDKPISFHLLEFSSVFGVPPLSNIVSALEIS